MKSHVLIATAIGMFAIPSLATSVSLSGTVLSQDSTAKSGVVVSLSGSSLTATTGDDGTWSFAGETGLAESPSGSRAAVSPRQVVLDGGRLHLAYDDRGIDGRRLPGASRIATAGTSAVRTTSSGTLDTLIYSWNGKVILRDTIGEVNLAQAGILRFFDTTINAAITYGYVSDAQGHLYRTTTIGTQTWMAQNLNYAVSSSWCYSNDVSYCRKYGRLYQWSAAMDTSTTYNTALLGAALPQQGICPAGWHVPSDAEWTTLTDTILSSSTAGTVLKSTSGWNSSSGTDAYGFHVLSAGYRYGGGGFDWMGTYSDFWSSSEYATTIAWSRYFYYGSGSVTSYDGSKTLGMSLRCLRD